MRLVVDSNILVSFFRPNPVNEIISKSSLNELYLFAPEYAIEELKKNNSDLLKYSKLNSEQLDIKFIELSSLIKIVPNESFKEFELEAKQISPHDKDIPIFALALSLNCPIWSNEPRFKEQSKIDVFSTREMIKLFDSLLSR